ncbi:uncharacterized protein LOC128710760 [Anopheles marshallii]|uniref:uncharacterized protein LOC128710760 n=1 Tax=Anopheles marshallii TaxID=1521116 RepID=UPI00237A0BC4|nr:uncharacterized protein LOC128710760 [Anopheles marshallii]
MRLEASKRMRLVPKGYIRLGGTKQKVEPATELRRGKSIQKASLHTDYPLQNNTKNVGQNSTEEHQHIAPDEEDPLAEHLLQRHQRVVIDRQDTSQQDLPEQKQQVVNDERDPLELDLSEQQQHTVKEERDPLEESLPEKTQVKEEQDPLEAHFPEQTVIKTECDDDQETNQSFDAKLRCWAMTHQIQPAALNALLVLMRQSNIFELATDK